MIPNCASRKSQLQSAIKFTYVSNVAMRITVTISCMSLLYTTMYCKSKDKGRDRTRQHTKYVRFECTTHNPILRAADLLQPLTPLMSRKKLTFSMCPASWSLNVCGIITVEAPRTIIDFVHRIASEWQEHSTNTDSTVQRTPASSHRETEESKDYAMVRFVSQKTSSDTKHLSAKIETQRIE